MREISWTYSFDSLDRALQFIFTLLYYALVTRRRLPCANALFLISKNNVITKRPSFVRVPLTLDI